MKSIVCFPKDLELISDGLSFVGDHFAFCVYEQDVSHEELIQTHTQMHSLILVQNGRKNIVIKGNELKISENQGLFLKSDTYKLSNISMNNLPYKAILIFFDNTLLIETIAKYNFFNATNNYNSNEEEFSSFMFNTSSMLLTIATSFEMYAQNIKNNKASIQSIMPLIKHKFEELFLYLNMEYSDIFCEFIRNIMREYNLSLDMASLLYGREYLNVSEMADMINIDQASFSRKFKSAFGLSPKNWLDEKRFDRAIALLQSSNKSIQEICVECGFSSPSWFIERFKKRYNQTPKQYQKSKNLYFLS